MKQDVRKEAQKRAYKEAVAKKFPTMVELKRFLDWRTNTWIKKLHLSDRSI